MNIKFGDKVEHIKYDPNDDLAALSHKLALKNSNGKIKDRIIT